MLMATRLRVQMRTLLEWCGRSETSFRLDNQIYFHEVESDSGDTRFHPGHTTAKIDTSVLCIQTCTRVAKTHQKLEDFCCNSILLFLSSANRS